MEKKGLEMVNFYSDWKHGLEIRILSFMVIFKQWVILNVNTSCHGGNGYWIGSLEMTSLHWQLHQHDKFAIMAL